MRIYDDPLILEMLMLQGQIAILDDVANRHWEELQKHAEVTRENMLLSQRIRCAKWRRKQGMEVRGSYAELKIQLEKKYG